MQLNYSDPKNANHVMFSPKIPLEPNSHAFHSLKSHGSDKHPELMYVNLGEIGDLALNEQFKLQHPDVWAFLMENQHHQDKATEILDHKKGEDMIPILEQIPFPDLTSKNIAWAPINQDLVHKSHNSNVLISYPIKQGRVQFFHGYSSSPEFRIDHPSDHVEGIVIFEALRQSAIASIHLSGLPLEGRMILLNANIKYKKFVSGNHPYFIRTITVNKPKGGNGVVVFELFQHKQSCVSGLFKSFSFRNRETYNRFKASREADANNA